MKDGIVAAPEKCKFDPQVLACKSGGDESQCLTAPKWPDCESSTTWATCRRARTKLSAMGGGLRQYAFGAAPGQSLQVMFANGFFGGLVFEKADWDYRSFDFAKDASTAQQKLGALLNASKTDLSDFSRRGGKLIQYHGLLDGSIPPAMSTTYYDRVAKQSGGVGKTQDFYRLFLAPGVLHCGFGPGPNAFGNLGPRPPADAESRHVARAPEVGRGGRRAEADRGDEVRRRRSGEGRHDDAAAVPVSAVSALGRQGQGRGERELLVEVCQVASASIGRTPASRGGPLGTQLAQAMLQKKLMLRDAKSRALRVTALGKETLGRVFGICVERLQISCKESSANRPASEQIDDGQQNDCTEQ